MAGASRTGIRDVSFSFEPQLEWRVSASIEVFRQRTITPDRHAPKDTSGIKMLQD
jgi:hypothetical protein